MAVRILLYIWQLPQNLIGLILVCIFTKRIRFIEDSLIVNSYPFKSSVNFGNYTFLVTINHFNHEKGHRIQSKILGWFYLPLIGLPSLISNITYRIKPFYGYYNLPWEKWADKLGELK